MITPEYLKQGDKIAIVSPSRKITAEEVRPAINTFQEWGLEVVAGEYLYSAYHQFAGSDEERLSDLQKMLDDDSVKAIVCSRGGYGTVRIIDEIDFSKLRENPKWIVGYSDITVLHSHIQKHYAIETLHAVMPVNFPAAGKNDLSVASLKKALFGETLEYELSVDSHFRKGMAEGILTGGNLSILHSLTGSDSDIETAGKILFLEDLDEYLYHIDRMMMNLKRSGKLEKLAGMIVGGMSGMHDNEVPFGKTANEIILSAVQEYDYPVCFNFPAGHLNENLAMIFGRKVGLRVGKKLHLSF